MVFYIHGRLDFPFRTARRSVRRYQDKRAEYQGGGHHNVISKEYKETGNNILENEQEQTIHIDVGYKNKDVKVRLVFSEEADDKNAKLFCDSLKKIYMEKTKIVL